LYIYDTPSHVDLRGDCVTDHPPKPTLDEVKAYFTTLTNWGRWGPEDELGTLNLITAEKRLEATSSVREGISVGCARPLMFEDRAADVLYPPQRLMIRSGDAPESTGAAEYVGVAFHGQTVSHVDALAHQFWDGKVYNDRPQTLITTQTGATVCSVEAMKDGIVTRGVLLDIPRLRGVPYLEAGDEIFPDELEAAEKAQGVRVGPGDALLVRTGWYRRRLEQGPFPVWRERPGLQAAALPWLRKREIAAVGADAAQDVEPSGYEGIPMPIHTVGLVAMGLCLLDNLQFEDLVETCERLRRWNFLFIVAPIRLRNGTGSPATPLAIF
jgi:kynurenine formamidase